LKEYAARVKARATGAPVPPLRNVDALGSLQAENEANNRQIAVLQQQIEEMRSRIVPNSAPPPIPTATPPAYPYYPPAPPPEKNQFSAAKEMLEFIGLMKTTFPTSTMDDVLKQIKLIREIEGEVQAPAGGDDMSQILSLLPHLMGKGTAAEARGNQTSTQTQEPHVLGSDSSPPLGPPNKNGVDTMKPGRITYVAKKIPQEYKEDIWNGTLTVEEAENMINDEMASKNMRGFSSHEIRQIFDEVMKSKPADFPADPPADPADAPEPENLPDPADPVAT